MSNNSKSHILDHADEFRQKAANIKHSVEELGSLTANVAQESIHQLRHDVEDALQQGKSKVLTWEDQLRTRIRQKPLESVAIVAGVAFVVGALWKRRG